MEPEGPISHRSIPATFSRDEKGEINHVKGLDSIVLLRLCASGSNHAAAWNEFSSRFKDKIRLFVYGAIQSLWPNHGSGSSRDSITSRPESEDLVQEVLLQLVANDCQLLKRFVGETEGAIFRYLSVISSSVVFQRYKYLRRQRRLPANGRMEVVDDAVFDRIGLSRDHLKIEKSILLQEILQMVENLLQEEIADAERRRRHLLIFRLHILDGLSLSEISEYGGINLSKTAVDKVLKKIIGRLREKLSAPKRQI